jgi:hypothetical protein
MADGPIGLLVPGARLSRSRCIAASRPIVARVNAAAARFPEGPADWSIFRQPCRYGSGQHRGHGRYGATCPEKDDPAAALAMSSVPVVICPAWRRLPSDVCLQRMRCSPTAAVRARCLHATGSRRRPGTDKLDAQTDVPEALTHAGLSSAAAFRRPTGKSRGRPNIERQYDTGMKTIGQLLEG